MNQVKQSNGSAQNSNIEWARINKYVLESVCNGWRITASRIKKEWVFTLWRAGSWYCFKWTPIAHEASADECKAIAEEKENG